MASEEKDFFAVKHEWMLEAVPADGTVELSDGRKLDLFLASAEGKAQSDPKYLVLVLHGGGYRFCSYREEHIVGRFFARAGFDAITIDYPTVPVTEAVGHGVGAAARRLLATVIKELRTREDLGFSSHKIILCGFSAGGHLAASMATLYGSAELADIGSASLLRPDGAILGYAVICADPQLNRGTTFTCCTGSADPQDWQPYSCERNVTADTPPLFIWHTATDQQVPVQHALSMAQAMWQHGNSCELCVLARGRHGVSLACDEVDPGEFDMVDDYLTQWFERALTFIRTFVH